MYRTDIQVLPESMKLQLTVVWGHHSYLLENTTLYNIPQIHHNFIQERKQQETCTKEKVCSCRYVHKRIKLFYSRKKSTRFKARAGIRTNSGRYKVIYNKKITKSKKPKTPTSMSSCHCPWNHCPAWLLAFWACLKESWQRKKRVKCLDLLPCLLHQLK